MAQDPPPPPPDPEATPELTGMDAVQQAALALTSGVKNNAAELLKAAGIEVQGDPAIASSGENDEVPDGFELKYSLQVGNFSGLDADLYVDYLVKGKNELGEPENWWESLVSFFKNKEKVENFGGAYNLNQLVFRFCRGNHASVLDKSPKIPQMLETIAFLQGHEGLVTVKASREEGKELPESEEEASHDAVQAMYRLKHHLQGKNFKAQGLNEGKNYPADRDQEWWNASFWAKVLAELSSKGFINQPLAASLTKTINQLEADRALETTIKNLEKRVRQQAPAKTMEGPGGRRDLFQRKLASVINQGPYRINYTAWDRMTISGDSAGNTILKIAAPMRPYFTLRKAKGGAPELVDASCLLCGKIFSSKPGNAAAAGKLAWAGVVLGRGAVLGVNPTESRHLDESSWLTDLKNQLPEAAKLSGEDMPQSSLEADPVAERATKVT